MLPFFLFCSNTVLLVVTLNVVKINNKEIHQLTHEIKYLKTEVDMLKNKLSELNNFGYTFIESSNNLDSVVGSTKNRLCDP
jgi:cell division protein FtsB